VGRKAYPHIFAYAGLTDPRVTCWEPAKWIARLRHLNASDNLILLKTNMEAGHGGASGRFEALKEVAVDYAFALGERAGGIKGRSGTGPYISYPRRGGSPTRPYYMRSRGIL
jgi:protease II